MIFLDTCILIDYLRGDESIHQLIISKSADEWFINSIIKMELFIGAQNKLALVQIKKKIQGFRLLGINQQVFNLAEQIVERYSLSHGARIQDSVIAATCLIYKMPLYTHNVKDFRYISGLELFER